MQVQDSDRSWVRGRVWFAAAGVLLVVLSLAVTIGGSSPRVCSACHAEQHRSLVAGPHVSARCYDCHLERGSWGLVSQKTDELFRMYPRALVRAGFGRPAKLTEHSSCLGCHRDVMSGPLTGRGMKIDHAACASEGSCDACHSSVAHGPDGVRWRTGPAMDDCTACHKARGAPLECVGCHVEPREAERSDGAWQVTHGPQWKHMHGMGDLDSCSTCHDGEMCKECHGIELPHSAEFGSTHGKAAMSDNRSCEVCHRTASFCDSCHGTQMPHPDVFLAQHTTIAKSTSDPACTRCHVPNDCSDCHFHHIHPGGSRGVPTPRLHSGARR